MEADEIHFKVNAIHRMKTIITALGTDDTMKKLLPLLENYVNTECDEVTFLIAEELGKVYDLLPDRTAFLPLLETLARSDETVVREQATKSLTTISKMLTDAEIQNLFSAMVIRLGHSDWFPGRISACYLFYPAYTRAGSQKEKLRKKFVELCNEDTPMVRRAGAA